MEQQKTICVKIPLTLYEEAKADKRELALSFEKYIAMVLREHLKRKGKMNASVRTLTFRISKELFMRMEEYLQKTGQSQQEFLEDLIEEALREESAAQEEQNEEATEDAEETMEEADWKKEGMTA